MNWRFVTRVSRATPTLQVVVNPLIRRSSPIHDLVFSELRALNADYVRFVPWYPYPRLANPELAPPSQAGASWDFTYLDPVVTDFMHATAGHPRIVNFSTTPEWMWKTPSTVQVPSDPDTIDFGYQQGGQLAVPLETVGDYYRRVASWYSRGGFTDELGRPHRSRHRFRIECWEVLNEVNLEHVLSAELYTQLYDAIVTSVRGVLPHAKFCGLALSKPIPDYCRYFLDPANHRRGVPIDFISYHFYASPKLDRPQAWGPEAFAQADEFLGNVDRVDAIRARLSPHTRTAVDEIGTVLPLATVQTTPEAIPSMYWNFSGAVFAYVFAQLAAKGIDVVSQSQLVGYPGQFPSASMVDWNTGKPNARFRVLQLLLKHMRPGIALCHSTTSSDQIYAVGFRAPNQRRKLLLINKQDRDVVVRGRGLAGARIAAVDASSRSAPDRVHVPSVDEYHLKGYAVALATLP